MNGKDLTQGSILGNIMTFIIAYNIIASIFRGLGDSKSPMYFVAVACVVNIVLDYLFIGFLGLGAMGAALGTTLSQISCLICVGAYWWMKKMNSTIKYNHSYWKNQLIDSLSDEQIEVWDKSVRSLHHFLSEKDLAY